MSFTSYKKAYRELHQGNPKIFSGRIDLEMADRIGDLVQMRGALTLLDWGSGKGYQYLRNRIHERWGGILPHCYDVGVIQLEHPPEGHFDGVICTDVLEHIRPEDVEDVLLELLGYTTPGGVIYMNICCQLAGKTFPNGDNVHLTVEPPAWWRNAISGAQTRAGRHDVYAWADFDYYGDHDLQRAGMAKLRTDDGGDVQEVLAD